MIKVAICDDDIQLIYCARYAKGYRKMKAYGNHLKRARRLLREEK